MIVNYWISFLIVYLLISTCSSSPQYAVYVLISIDLQTYSLTNQTAYPTSLPIYLS